MNPRFYPIFLFLFCFFADKLFFLPIVRDNFVLWNRFEMIAYETRDHLFEIYEAEKNSKRRYVLLGSSRLASFQRNEFESNLDNISFYNFSVPFPSVSYQLFLLEKLITSSKKPDLVIWELDLPFLTEASQQYPFRYSFSLSFFWKHRDIWRWKDWVHWMGRNLFLVWKYPISGKAIVENFQSFQFEKDGKLVKIRKKSMIPKTREIFLELNQHNHGGIQIPFPNLKKSHEEEASSTWNQLFSANHFPNEQIVFLDRMKSRLESEKIPFLIVIPPHSPEYGAILKSHSQDLFFFHLLESRFSKGEILDLNALNLCQEFEDAFHVAGTCIPEFTYAVIEKIPR